MSPSLAYSPIERSIQDIYYMIVSVAHLRRLRGEPCVETVAVTPDSVWVLLRSPRHWMLLAQRDQMVTYLIDSNHDRGNVIFLSVEEFENRIRSQVTATTTP